MDDYFDSGIKTGFDSDEPFLITYVFTGDEKYGFDKSLKEENIRLTIRDCEDIIIDERSVELRFDANHPQFQYSASLKGFKPIVRQDVFLSHAWQNYEQVNFKPTFFNRYKRYFPYLLAVLFFGLGFLVANTQYKKGQSTRKKQTVSIQKTEPQEAEPGDSIQMNTEIAPPPVDTVKEQVAKSVTPENTANKAATPVNTVNATDLQNQCNQFLRKLDQIAVTTADVSTAKTWLVAYQPGAAITGYNKLATKVKALELLFSIIREQSADELEKFIDGNPLRENLSWAQRRHCQKVYFGTYNDADQRKPDKYDANERARHRNIYKQHHQNYTSLADLDTEK
ncbi:MAG: hypothetical protein LBN18_07455 [Dysgonamonadaceae bacterium]|jgi:hypothetical protein|nr:hypothetical protein [Dysgonamonadaceae bacterium]